MRECAADVAASSSEGSDPSRRSHAAVEPGHYSPGSDQHRGFTHDDFEYTRPGRDAFLADTKTQDAVIRNLEMIGEAVKNLS